ESMALTGVNGNLPVYEALRKIDVPLDTEPAFAFHPALPGSRAIATARRASTAARASRVANRQPSRPVPSFKSVEELAFCTVAELSELVRTRKVSPVELTRMYLSRLKRYGPRLLCVVTLTEELAMKQAEQAESEIKAGKYRGPLHGIPWGAKDLFA